MAIDAAVGTALKDVPTGSAAIAASRRGIIGTGSALPERRLTNNELAQFIDTSDEWIQERVGIQSRYVVGPGESCVDLALQASLSALESAGIAPNDLDVIVFGTVTPDKALPSAASLLQQRLGCKHAMAFDLQAACAGFLFALGSAHGLQLAQGFRTALVIGAETLSRIVDWSDRNTCVLFGDGAGAVILQADEPGDQPCIEAMELSTRGDLCDLIQRPGGAYPASTLPAEIIASEVDNQNPYIHMNGAEVFKQGIVAMCTSINSVLKKAGCTADDIDVFVPHQSNQRMIESVCQRIGINKEEKLISNLEVVGNTSAASIPIALDEAVRAGRVQPGDRVLLTAVGAGISYGSILLRW